MQFYTPSHGGDPGFKSPRAHSRAIASHSHFLSILDKFL
ncbi:hypothetical protein YN1HA_16210 [Sulfurisphaera ohwakuensis]